MMNYARLTILPLLKKISLIMALGLTFTSQALAFDHKYDDAPTMQIEQAWARALPPVVPNGAAYLNVKNNTDEDDVLEGVSSDIAKHSMLHESYFEDGKVAMRHVDNLTLLSGKSVEFKPGGYHIMLMGLKRALVAGQSFKVTLHFKRAGDVTTVVNIAKSKTKHHSHHH